MPPTTARYFEAMLCRNSQARLAFAIDEMAELKSTANFVGMQTLAETLEKLQEEIAMMICRLEPVAREVSIADEFGAFDPQVESDLIGRLHQFISQLDKIG